jgi:hypothetical protein
VQRYRVRVILFHHWQSSRTLLELPFNVECLCYFVTPQLWVLCRKSRRFGGSYHAAEPQDWLHMDIYIGEKDRCLPTSASRSWSHFKSYACLSYPIHLGSIIERTLRSMPSWCAFQSPPSSCDLNIASSFSLYHSNPFVMSTELFDVNATLGALLVGFGASCMYGEFVPVWGSTHRKWIGFTEYWLLRYTCICVAIHPTEHSTRSL